MTPEELGIKTPSGAIGVHKGRVIFQHGETVLGFDPPQAILLASLLLQNAVKEMNPASEVVKEAVDKAFGEEPAKQN